MGDDESVCMRERERGKVKVQTRGSVGKQFVITDVYVRQGGKKSVETARMWRIMLFTCFKLAHFLILHFHH